MIFGSRGLVVQLGVTHEPGNQPTCHSYAKVQSLFSSQEPQRERERERALQKKATDREKGWGRAETRQRKAWPKWDKLNTTVKRKVNAIVYPTCSHPATHHVPVAAFSPLESRLDRPAEPRETSRAACAHAITHHVDADRREPREAGPMRPGGLHGTVVYFPTTCVPMTQRPCP
jgi:hypothetical protein